MTFQEFRQLIGKGETASIDFKLTCNAFDKTKGDHEKAKAELVKDICAMANNAPTISYLVIGVSDDRQQCQSVPNPKLTSSNIQTLIRDSIHPHPRVKVFEKCWSNVPLPFKNKKFVIIQIGPNAKDAYQFNKDYIHPGSAYNFRKNQVWIRNQDTSDIATPEQIVRLKSKRTLSQHEEGEEDLQGINYERLSTRDQVKAIGNDLQRVLREHDFRIAKFKRGDGKIWWGCADDDFRVIGKIKNKKFVFLCGVRPSFSKSYSQWNELNNSWTHEDALLFLLLDNVGKAGTSDHAMVNYSMPWGWYSLCPTPLPFWLRHSNIDKSGLSLSLPSISFMSLPRIRHTSILRQKVTAMLESLESDPQTSIHVQNGRRNLHILQQQIRKIPWPVFRKDCEISLGRVDADQTLYCLKSLRRKQ